MKEMLITTGMTEITIIKGMTTEDTITKMITTIDEGDCKEEFKTMETEKIVHVDPFSATHASMKDIDM